MLQNNITPLSSYNHTQFKAVYSHLFELQWTYNNFNDWYWIKVRNEIIDGNRKIFLYKINRDIAGILIIKNYGHKKISTLKVMNKYKGAGIGKKLFEFSMNELNSRYPFFTISGKKLNEFNKIISYYGYKFDNKKISIYNNNQFELYYNIAR